MSKTTTITAITIAILILIGLVGYLALKPSSTPNSVMSNNGMMGEMHSDSMRMGMTNISDLVKDDQSFIENMIPHHQEAVDSSNQILVLTKDSELKTFVQNVITAQTKEITEMKSWYKLWFSKDYISNSSYQSMMGGMVGKSGTELDKEYVKGMITHHQGAIQMANKIQSITKRSELLNLANDIITSQTKERTTLMDWMMSKYNDHGMMGM